MLLRIALQIARDDYKDRREHQRQGIELAKARNKYRGRPADPAVHARIVAFARSWGDHRQHCAPGRCERHHRQACVGRSLRARPRELTAMQDLRVGRESCKRPLLTAS